MIIVIAGNYREFRVWCTENRISYTSPLLLYAHRPEQVRGLTNIWQVVTFGSWHIYDTLVETYHQAIFRRNRFYNIECNQ